MSEQRWRPDDGEAGRGRPERHEGDAGSEWSGGEAGSGRPERAEWYEYEQHAGNGTVNHGPESSYDGPGTPRDGADTSSDGADTSSDGFDDSWPPGEDGAYPGELGSDELALRRMLHHAVQDIEPTDGSLEHLRRAVPARRARKRQAVVGMAAAALFVGTAIPALVHVSNSPGSTDTPSIAGHAGEAQGGGDGKSPDGGEKSDGSNSSASKSQGKDGGKGKNDPSKGATGAATGGPDTASTAAASSPACGVNELGNAGVSVEPAQSDGKVYGTFTVSNVSSANCTVEAAGTMSFQAQGAADATKISLVDHTAGDGSGLPDPSQEASQLILQPGKSYQVRIAWVPSETCPTTNGGGDDGEPSPAPSPSQNSATGATGGTDGTSEQSGTTTQLVTEDGGTADGSVVVAFTAETGTATVTATVPNACAGTIYRTGVLASE
ncbi:ICP22 family protein [Streptomyces jeddahensis]|uniref:DUF4232 domain-containing protein n=1 Tax=Streptomyces jeddahensis TaxID=1716141 RepID=A0A177I013_9ACTN|nr:hypothetical protein [Streptomyces jeddahensis]OAH16441.1 hypothetical protein STSP_01650 [Streptomyces jeddahensis]